MKHVRQSPSRVRVVPATQTGRATAGDGAPGPDAALLDLQRTAGNAAVSAALGGDGQPLDPATRASMEGRLGHDFSAVRVHTGLPAAVGAQALGARAFTVGQDIAFGAGQPDAASVEGKRLLVHELAHTVQQGGPSGTRSSASPGRAEAEAGQVGDRVAAGQAAGVRTSAGAGVQRAPDLKTGDDGVDRLFDVAIEEVDGSAREKVLISILLATRSKERMKLLALALQARFQSPYGNYLNYFFVKLKEDDEDIANKFIEILAKEGVEVASFSGHFQSLEYLDPSVKAPVNPAIANAPPERYVDKFTAVKYDLEYKRRGGALSETLQVSYADGTRIDINMWDIADNIDKAAANAIARGYVGLGGRTFPSRMSRNTVPRLWAEKQKALGVMNESNEDFITFVSIGLAGVMSNLPIGPVVEPEPVIAGAPGGRPARTPTALPKEPPVAVPVKEPPPVTEPPVRTPAPKPPPTRETVDEFVARGGNIKKVPAKPTPQPKVTAAPKNQANPRAGMGEGPEVEAVQPATPKRAGVTPKPKTNAPAPKPPPRPATAKAPRVEPPRVEPPAAAPKPKTDVPAPKQSPRVTATKTPRTEPPAASPKPAPKKETVDEYVARGGEIKKIKAKPVPKPKVTAAPKGQTNPNAHLGEGQEAEAVNETTRARAGLSAKPKHHAFPQEHRPYFESHGFTGDRDIDNYTVELEEAEHQAIHGGGDFRKGRTWPKEWNQRAWSEIQKAQAAAGHDLSFDEIFAVITRLMQEYKIDKPFVPYR
jgi:hypothetical protein